MQKEQSVASPAEGNGGITVPSLLDITRSTS